MREFARRALPGLVFTLFAAVWTAAVYTHHANIDYAASSAYLDAPAATAYASPSDVGFTLSGHGCEWNSRYGLGCFRAE